MCVFDYQLYIIYNYLLCYIIIMLYTIDNQTHTYMLLFTLLLHCYAENSQKIKST